jgi:hypothetical protein
MIWCTNYVERGSENLFTVLELMTQCISSDREDTVEDKCLALIALW